MWYIIVGIIVLFGLWKGKPFLKGLIISYRNKNKNVKVVNSDLVYVPIKSSRTFTFSIEIEEVGDGKAVVSVVKQKALQD